MKFIKVTIDGKEYYERIDDDATVGDKTQEPEVIDAEIEDGEELSGTEKFMRDTEGWRRSAVSVTLTFLGEEPSLTV